MEETAQNFENFVKDHWSLLMAWVAILGMSFNTKKRKVLHIGKYNQRH